MVAIGAILLVKVIHCGAYVAAHDEHAQRFHSVSFTFNCVVVLLVFLGWPTLMLVFGSLCVANGHYCGPAGHGGGIALVVSGAVCSLAVLALALKLANDYAARFDSAGDPEVFDENPGGAGEADPLPPQPSQPSSQITTSRRVGRRVELGAAATSTHEIPVDGEQQNEAMGESLVAMHEILDDAFALAAVHANNAVMLVDLVIAQLFGVFGGICVDSGGNNL